MEELGTASYHNPRNKRQWGGFLTEKYFGWMRLFQTKLKRYRRRMKILKTMQWEAMSRVTMEMAFRTQFGRLWYQGFQLF